LQQTEARPSVESETMSSPANHVSRKEAHNAGWLLTMFYSRKSKNRRIGFALVVLGFFEFTLFPLDLMALFIVLA
jgi:hypothetical protein